MNQRITFRQLEYLVAVGELGSITAASDHLNVSSPSISTAISQLEDDLKIQMFVRRHARGLTLTTSGKRLVEEAKGILELGAESGQDCQGYAGSCAWGIESRMPDHHCPHS
jgi:DNA-binding transcriptional LysR family regulator